MGVSYDWWLNMSELEYYSWHNDVFSNDDLDLIDDLINYDKLELGTTTDKNITDTRVRDSKIKFLESSNDDHKWIFGKLTGAINDANDRFFQFNLDRIESLQYTTYSEGQFYKDHLDLLYRSSSNAIRKLSFSVQLSDPTTYEGGDLVLKTSSHPQVVTKSRGTVIFFPSYILHEVTPVTKGLRKSLVGWVTGPRWK